jgi:hypothetical protein
MAKSKEKIDDVEVVAPEVVTPETIEVEKVEAEVVVPQAGHPSRDFFS